MKTIKELREAIDAQLDKIQAKAEATQAQLELNKTEIDARLEEQEKTLLEAAQKLTGKLEEAGVVAEEETTKIKGSLENLQVQLALGKAETRDAFNQKKAEIMRRIAEFNAELDAAKASGDQAAADDIKAELEIYVIEVSALESELEAINENYPETQEKG